MKTLDEYKNFSYLRYGLKMPAANIISSFEKEYSCNISVKFLHADDAKTKVEKLYSDPIIY